jgi:hypothetical protein
MPKLGFDIPALLTSRRFYTVMGPLNQLLSLLTMIGSRSGKNNGVNRTVICGCDLVKEGNEIYYRPS